MLAAAEMSLLFFCRIEHEAGGATHLAMSEYNSDAIDERQLQSSGSGGKNTAKVHNTDPHAIAGNGRR